MKRCSLCDEWKPYQAFHRDAGRPDGRCAWCKECRLHHTPAKLVVEREAWQQNGACIGLDPDLFYPERGQSVGEAKAVCATCTVKVQCLEYALRIGEKAGIWGGLSTRERKLLRARKQGIFA